MPIYYRGIWQITEPSNKYAKLSSIDSLVIWLKLFLEDLQGGIDPIAIFFLSPILLVDALVYDVFGPLIALIVVFIMVIAIIFLYFDICLIYTGCKKRNMKSTIYKQIDNKLLEPSRIKSICSANLIYLPYLSNRLSLDVAKIIHSYLTPPSRPLHLLHDDWKFYFDNWLYVDKIEIDEFSEFSEIKPAYISLALGDSQCHRPLRLILPEIKVREREGNKYLCLDLREYRKNYFVLSNIEFLFCLNRSIAYDNGDNYVMEHIGRIFEDMDFLLHEEQQQTKNLKLDETLYDAVIEVMPLRSFRHAPNRSWCRKYFRII